MTLTVDTLLLQGTYYGDQSGAGHCSFQFSNSYTLPWTTGVYTGVAVNAPQYSGSAPCGMCVAFWGTGPGDHLMHSINHASCAERS